MGKHDLMKNPHYAQIMFHIESLIHEADHEALEEGKIIPKDSAVKSALRKAELGLGGKKPAHPPKDVMELWTTFLAESLMALAVALEENDGCSKRDFIVTLGAARDSLDTRREMGNSPRGYLDFLDGFLGQMGNG